MLASFFSKCHFCMFGAGGLTHHICHKHTVYVHALVSHMLTPVINFYSFSWLFGFSVCALVHCVSLFHAVVNVLYMLTPKLASK